MMLRFVALVLALSAGLGCKKDEAPPAGEPSAGAEPADNPTAPPPPPPAAAPTDAAAAAAATTDSAPDPGAPDTAEGTPPEPPSGEPNPDDKPPTNLKVLPKKWTRAQVNDFMKKRVNRGLGVKCDFCHDKTDFASDANEHKVIARNMLKMTTAMDKKFFAGKNKLTCYTCHKGKEEIE